MLYRLQLSNLDKMKNSSECKTIMCKKRHGFGLLEVVIVLAILSIILGALIWIGRAAAANNIRSQQRAQAVYLAQEGIEVVRQIRDSNWIDGDNTTTWEDVALIGGVLARPATPTQSVPSARFTTDYSLGRAALLSLPISGAVSTDFSDVSSGDNPTINGTEFRRSIYLEQYHLPASDNLPGDGIAADGTIYYLKVRSVVIWKAPDGTFSVNNSANKIESSEILTNWRPNY